MLRRPPEHSAFWRWSSKSTMRRQPNSSDAEDAALSLMMMVKITPLLSSQVEELTRANCVLNKPAGQYERYFKEQERGERTVLVAYVDNAVSGYVTIVWQSDYDVFAADRIPEIQDFNVLPPYRRRSIGTKLMDEAERRILEHTKTIGIGVGLHHDYGAAQRLYVKRGYIPDARGVTSHGRRVNFGDTVTADDDLVLWFTKTI